MKYLPTHAGYLGNRQARRVSYILILATLVTYLMVGLISLSFHDWRTVWAICGGSLTLAVPYLLFRSGHDKIGNLFLMTIAVVTVTAIATVGQGIRDLALVACPIIFIYIGLTSDRVMLVVCGSLTFLSLLWLAFGESLHWFATVPLFPDPMNLFYLAVLSVLLGVCALAVDLLSRSMRTGIEQARIELEERRRSEARFRAVVENGYDGILFCDADSKILYRSPSSSLINGYSDDERIGHSGFDTVHPEDADAVREVWERIVGHPERAFTFEYRIRHKDGSWRWIETSGRSLLDNPDVRAVITASRDINAGKQASAALRESEERFRRMFEGHSAPMLVIEPESGSIVNANEAAAKFYGWPTSTLTSMTIQQINMMPAERVKRDMARAELSEQARFEFRHRTADGSVRDVEVYSSNIEYGGKAMLYSVIHDISERKRAEELLRQGEERYRLIFETAPLAIIITRGVEIVYANPSYLIMLGFSSLDELKRYPPLGTFTPESVDLIKENIERRSKGLPVPDSYETECLRTDGSKFPAIMNLAQAAFADGPATVTFLVDLSEHKRTEAEQRNLRLQLEQAQKMESVGRLAGGVAHDFNNMLMVISGNAQIGLQLTEATSSVHANLVEISKAAERSAELTRQLLSFARRQTVSPKVLDLSETVQGMLMMLKRLIGENIRLQWEVSAGLWNVIIDPSQLDQILANLCVNARDAIADVGTIKIETKNSTLDQAFCAEHAGCIVGEYVLLEVTDDGCGMDEETQKHLFEPFFTTKPLGQGTGLGLATVYGAVKQNNGFINFKSARGAGTAFSIYLPRYVGAAEEAVKDREEDLRGSETVLVVEDESASLRLIVIMLQGYGYTVLFSTTPEEAVRIGTEKSSEIDLLLTDVVMPNMNGRDLSVRLTSSHPRMRTLFMSGYTSDVIATRGVLDKGVFFIQKPFGAVGLAKKVREALEGRDQK